MRTDVTIDTKKKLRCPQIPYINTGRQAMVGRGDFILFSDPGRVERMARVVGVVCNPDDGKEYFCVVMFMLGGSMWERWVLPEDVTDSRLGEDYMCLYGDKAKWFHSAEFLDTPVDKARRVSDMLYEDLVKEEK